MQVGRTYKASGATWRRLIRFYVNYASKLIDKLNDKVYLHKTALLMKYFSFLRIHIPGISQAIESFLEQFSNYDIFKDIH